MPKINDVDRRVLSAMSGAERMKLLLKDAGFPSLRSFAVEHGLYVQEVSYCLNGDREYGRIRDLLAEDLGLSRTEVDRLIDGEGS